LLLWWRSSLALERGIENERNEREKGMNEKGEVTELMVQVMRNPVWELRRREEGAL